MLGSNNNSRNTDGTQELLVFCGHVTCDVDETEEVSINIEEAIDIKDEIPEAITFPPIKTEHEHYKYYMLHLQ
jgi:hypothetical protein